MAALINWEVTRPHTNPMNMAKEGISHWWLPIRWASCILGEPKPTVICAKFDPSRRGQSGILRKALKARKPVPQAKLLEQIDVNCKFIRCHGDDLIPENQVAGLQKGLIAIKSPCPACTCLCILTQVVWAATAFKTIRLRR